MEPVHPHYPSHRHMINLISQTEKRFERRGEKDGTSVWLSELDSGHALVNLHTWMTVLGRGQSIKNNETPLTSCLGGRSTQYISNTSFASI